MLTESSQQYQIIAAQCSTQPQKGKNCKGGKGEGTGETRDGERHETTRNKRVCVQRGETLSSGAGYAAHLWRILQCAMEAQLKGPIV